MPITGNAKKRRIRTLDLCALLILPLFLSGCGESSLPDEVPETPQVSISFEEKIKFINDQFDEYCSEHECSDVPLGYATTRHKGVSFYRNISHNTGGERYVDSAYEDAILNPIRRESKHARFWLYELYESGSPKRLLKLQPFEFSPPGCCRHVFSLADEKVRYYSGWPRLDEIAQLRFRALRIRALYDDSYKPFGERRSFKRLNRESAPDLAFRFIGQSTREVSPGIGKYRFYESKAPVFFDRKIIVECRIYCSFQRDYSDPRRILVQAGSWNPHGCIHYVIGDCSLSERDVLELGLDKTVELELNRLQHFVDDLELLEIIVRNVVGPVSVPNQGGN